ncbi:MAG: prepilin peptidase [Candidatus Dormibacteraeota bacterium]|uniref:Prepilin peptidase n=1 Tax=Candidatus Amunia macphersoniae TaxID=3127014 RepID=A0A934KIT6_9BACT|nr:prepilin peptidase [Candidatus Dormibacteraeota bacterium]
MSAVAAAVAAPVGAVVGLGAGWLSVVLERIEGLEVEDREDREAYERELAEATSAAVAAGEEAPVTEPWPVETYGWSWIERILCPLLAAIGFAVFAAHEGLGRGLVIHLLWVAVFVQIVGFDVKHRLILNRVTYPTIVVALALSVLSPGLTIWSAVAGGIAVWLFFWIQNLVSRGSIGLGDAKLGALLGATCGISLDYDHIGAVYAVIYAVFLGGAVALLLLVLRLRSLKDPIPYGPFLCAGAALILYQGP